MGYKLVMCSALTQSGLNKVFDTAIDIMISKREETGENYKKASETDCQLIWTNYQMNKIIIFFTFLTEFGKNKLFETFILH